MKTAPRRHQLAEFEQHRDDRARALLWYMRSGKSKTMIDLACYLRKERGLKNVIVIAPNGVHQVWKDEQLPVHHWDDIPYNAIVIDSKKVGQKGFNAKVQARVDVDNVLLWTTLIKEALNVARVRLLLYDIIKTRGKTLLIVDECQHFGNTLSQRSDHVQALAARCDYKRILTGSEADDGLENLFAQYQILKPGALGCNTLLQFTQRYCESVVIHVKNRNDFKIPREKITGYKNVKKLKRLVAKWSSRVTRKDADLPDLVPMTRKFDPPPEIRKVYDQVIKDGHLGILGHEDRTALGMSALNVLGQISSGFVYDENPRKAVEFAKNPRLDVLADFLETVPTDEQVIVWCAYGHEVKQVHQLLGGGGDVATYYGGNSQIVNKAGMTRFKRGHAHTFVGTPHSGGEGLELGCASVIVWFSHVTSNRLRNQASERASGAGDSVALVDIVANCKSDRFLVKAYADKANIAKLVKGRSILEVLEDA